MCVTFKMNFQLISLQILIIFSILSISSANRSDDLKRIFVLAKQGDLPAIASYLNDTNLDIRNWPNGLSKLDQSEQVALIRLGQQLKAKYNNKIQPSNTEIYAELGTTGSDSARLVSSGIKNNETGPKTSDWQIIETNDRRICASGLIELRRSASSAASIRLLNKHSQLVAQMRSRGGVPDVNAIHFSLLSRILIQYQQRGLSLPDWLNNETQKQIRQLAQESLQEMLQKPAIRALLVGPVLEKVKADLIRTALDFEPNDTLKTVIYMVHASELAAISVIMNATDLSTDQSGSALLFEQYENGSIRIKFLDGQEEHALPYVDCGHTDQLKVADCESINLIKKFNHLLSENWKDTCARQSNESQSDVLPYSESKAKQLINLIDRIRHQNQTLDLNPVFNRTPELIDLIERVGHKKHPGLRRQWKEHEVNEKERNVTQRDSDGEDAQNEDEDDDDDDDLKRLFKEELKKQGEEKVMRRRQRQQRKNKLRSLIRQIVNERLSDDYEEVVQEWQNRTKESKNAKVDFDRMAKRVWERVQAKKERQRQLMRRLVEQLDEKVNEKRRSRDEENADRIEMSSSKLKLLIDLVASLKAKHNRNDSNRATIERLVDSEVRRPAWDHHERRMVVGSAGNLESIDELDESDSDDEDDEDELDAGSSAENDVNADDNDDSDPTDNESTNDSKLSGMQRFLIKAAEYRANKMRQIHSYSERIQSRMAERRQRQADRLELEHKIESLLNREANIRVARLRDQLMSKMKQIRDSDNYVEQMYDFLDEDSSRDRLIGELRYQILAELLAYAKKSEQSETNDWSELINLLVNRRRLRSMAGIEADRLISEVTATNQHKSNQSNSVNVVSDSARLTNPIPTTILLRATATNDTTVQPSEATQSNVWKGAIIGIVLLVLVIALIVFVIRKRASKRKQYVRV